MGWMLILSFEWETKGPNALVVCPQAWGWGGWWTSSDIHSFTRDYILVKISIIWDRKGCGWTKRHRTPEASERLRRNLPWMWAFDCRPPEIESMSGGRAENNDHAGSGRPQEFQLPAGFAHAANPAALRKWWHNGSSLSRAPVYLLVRLGQNMSWPSSLKSIMVWMLWLHTPAQSPTDSDGVGA